ncbi:MFS transporter [Streptomyces sp. C36]|uniref:MFS transporter n=1 Tax=Streptomyces sp. C36 TaxID=3237122 RepID=UPI0034C5D6C1
MSVEPASPAVSAEAVTEPGAAGPYPRRWAAAAVLTVAFLMDLLDVTIVNVALPTIQRELDASPTQLEWISASYLLAFAVALITTARLGDVWGRKRIFLYAVALFGLASLWCSFADSPTELIVARVVQGLAAAGIAPQVMSTLQSTFEGRERATVFGLFGIVAGMAQALGLVVGGVLITANVGDLGWRTLFLVNVPVAALVIAFGAWLVPETKVPGGTRPNLLSAAVLTVGLVAVVFPLMEGRQYGWPVWCWLSLAAGVVAIVALALAEERGGGRRNAPLLPAGLFRDRSFSGGLAVLLLAFASYNGFLLVLTLWLQDGQGYSPLRAGLVTVSFCVGSLFTAVVAGRLTVRFGRGVVMAGCLLFAVGTLGVLVAARAAGGTVSSWSLVPGLVVLGAALNLIIPPLVTLFTSAVPPRHVGTASGIWSTTQQFGGSLGVAVMGSVFFSALDGGYRSAFTVIAAATATALVVCAILALALAPRERTAA